MTNKNGELLNICDFIFLGVKPGMLQNAIIDCVKTQSDKHDNSKHIVFISMLVGINIGQLYKVTNMQYNKKMNVLYVSFLIHISQNCYCNYT